ncbi:MAG: DnaJ domain-containing protein [Desulfobacterales bacterium]|jgi:curved DNA-binding protein CbpA|nr:DnaJ domain-containing protein [Desulfobacterales bacterium]
MLSSYFIMGLDLDATDEEIRKRYLELIKRYTPEKDPNRFQEITSAYEQIKTPRARIRGKLFGPLSVSDAEEALLSLGRARTPVRRRAGLKELLDEAS